MSLSRRQFVAVLGAGLTRAATERAAAQEPTPPLRVIAYNIYGCTGWPKDRTLAKRAVAKGQMARRLALELALYEPPPRSLSRSPSIWVCTTFAFPAVATGRARY